MSLDVYLTMPDAKVLQGSGIFIRENGVQKEITEQEWYERFPDRQPVKFLGKETDEVYCSNITHNLGTMAAQAGLYEVLWRPEEIGITKAKDMVSKLALGLNTLKDNPSKYKEYNPVNGWGDYEGLVNFVDNYLTACIEYPEADVNVSR